MNYLDTSIVAAFYLPEAMSRKVQKFYALRDTAAISALTEVEFYSVVSRRVRMKDLTRNDALKVVSLFRAHVDGNFYRFVAVAQREYALARDWLATFQTPLRTLDALHLAAAFSYDCVLVTADSDLGRAARHFGVKHKLIS